jgi:iron(III) transport system ATP-binding protein
VILLDEPLSNLDAKLREEARAWLRQLITSLGLSALCVTHDQVEAMALADRIILLNGGVVEQEGTPTELYTAPRSLFAAEFMGSNSQLSGTLASRQGGQAEIEVEGQRLRGVDRGSAAPGAAATGVIRLEAVRVGGAPGDNGLTMTLATQMYLGERWEVVFTRGETTVRAYAHAPLAESEHRIEFPPDALWIF